MRVTVILLFSVLLFGCEKNNPAPNEPITNTESTNTGSPNNDHLGLIQFDMEVAGVLTHHEYYIDSLTDFGINVANGQGGYDQEMFYVGPNIRSINFTYIDSDGVTNKLALTQTINNTTNSISIINNGENPYVAQTNTNYPLCNTADFEIEVISENEATFAADHLYNYHTEEGVNITNGSYVMY